MKERLANQSGTNYLATTGFNLSKIPKSDPTLDAKNHKYGRETMCLPHPCVKE